MQPRKRLGAPPQTAFLDTEPTPEEWFADPMMLSQAATVAPRHPLPGGGMALREKRKAAAVARAAFKYATTICPGGQDNLSTAELKSRSSRVGSGGWNRTSYLQFMRLTSARCSSPQTENPCKYTNRSCLLYRCESHKASPTAEFFQPRAKSAISAGAALSNPTTSSMPVSSGSAILKPVAVIPMTISLALIPIRSRYFRSASAGAIR